MTDEHASDSTNGCVLTIGVYDAVHRGHRAILAKGRALADAHGVPLVVLAFDPHPATVLRPGSQPPRLISASQKVLLLHQAGADTVHILTPEPSLFAMSPQAFIQKIVDEYHPIAMVEGENFRFGHQRQGDGAMLESLGKQHGFEVHVQPSEQVMLCDQLLVTASSSMVRWLVGHGRVADAARCLGRCYALQGRVMTGEKRGRTIGVPTANLDLSDQPDLLVPADGVYAGIAQLHDERTFPAAISVGTKPTFDNEVQLTVEAHLPGFAGDLYDTMLELRFARFVRDQQPFPNVDALKAQLQRDIAQTIAWQQQGVLADIHQPDALA